MAISRFFFPDKCGESPSLKEHFEKIDSLIGFADEIDPFDIGSLREKLDFIQTSFDEIKESAQEFLDFEDVFTSSLQDDIRNFLAQVPFRSSSTNQRELEHILHKWASLGASQEDLHVTEDLIERFLRGTSSTRDFDPCKDIPNIVEYPPQRISDAVTTIRRAIKKPPKALAPDPDESPEDISAEVEEYFEEVVNVEATPSEEDIAEGALLQETPTQPRWHPADRLEHLHNSGLATTDEEEIERLEQARSQALAEQAIERERAFRERQEELEREVAQRRAEEAELRASETEEETQARLRRQLLEKTSANSAALQQAANPPEQIAEDAIALQEDAGVADVGQVPTPHPPRPESKLYNQYDFYPSRFAQNNASKINRLHPSLRRDFQRFVATFISTNITDGYDINVCETFRSGSRNPIGPQGEIAELKPGASWYNYGAAAAIYIYQNNEAIDPVTRGGEYARLLSGPAALFGIRMPQSREMTHFTSLKLPQFVPEELAKGEITFDQFIQS